MGWITSFAGLRKLGASPWLALATLAAVFIVTKMMAGGDPAPAD